jgi:hypothetical protein
MGRVGWWWLVVVVKGQGSAAPQWHCNRPGTRRSALPYTNSSETAPSVLNQHHLHPHFTLHLTVLCPLGRGARQQQAPPRPDWHGQRHWQDCSSPCAARGPREKEAAGMRAEVAACWGFSVAHTRLSGWLGTPFVLQSITLVVPVPPAAIVFGLCLWWESRGEAEGTSTWG